MPVQKLDAQFCLLAQCRPGKKKTDYYDEAIKGFVLECRPGGKTFYLRYQNAHGRQKQHRIAGYGDARWRARLAFVHRPYGLLLHGIKCVRVTLRSQIQRRISGYCEICLTLYK